MDASLLDGLPTIAVNAGVFVGMVIVTILGWKFGKKAKEGETPMGGSNVMVAGLIQDNMSALMQSEATKVLAERVGTNTHCVERNTDEIKELIGEIGRLNRNIERLKDL